MKNGSRFFRNAACEYFPCHAVADTADFNCLFCYCPLYGRADCGGDFTFTADGVKDCSHCTLPHEADKYDEILHRLK